MSTEILITRAATGEALVTFPSEGPRQPRTPDRGWSDDLTAHTVLFFDDPFGTTKGRKKDDHRWLFFPTQDTTRRLAEYLKEYAGDKLTVEALTAIQPPPAEVPQPFIRVAIERPNGDILRLNLSAGEVANNLVRTTGRRDNEHFYQVPERTFPEAIDALLKEAAQRTEDDPAGDVWYTFERPARPRT